MYSSSTEINAASLKAWCWFLPALPGTSSMANYCLTALLCTISPSFESPWFYQPCLGGRVSSSVWVPEKKWNMVSEEKREVNLPSSPSPPIQPHSSSTQHHLPQMLEEFPTLWLNPQHNKWLTVPACRGGLGFPASPMAHVLWPWLCWAGSPTS